MACPLPVLGLKRLVQPTVLVVADHACENGFWTLGVVNVQPEFASGGSGLDPFDRSGNEHA